MCFSPDPPEFAEQEMDQPYALIKIKENSVMHYSANNLQCFVFYLLFIHRKVCLILEGKYRNIYFFIFLTVQHFLHEPLALAGPTPILISIDFSSPPTHSTSQTHEYTLKNVLTAKRCSLKRKTHVYHSFKHIRQQQYDEIPILCCRLKSNVTEFIYSTFNVIETYKWVEFVSLLKKISTITAHSRPRKYWKLISGTV